MYHSCECDVIKPKPLKTLLYEKVPIDFNVVNFCPWFYQL
jgi:hypothetical protein